MPLATPMDPDNVRSWDSITFFTGAVGSTAPTDTTTALDAAFKNNGLISEDDLTQSVNVDRNELHSQGGKLVRVKRTSQTRQWTVTLLENSHQVFTIANPGSTAATATGVTTRHYKAQTTALVAIVIEAVEGDIVSRFWIPSAEVFADGDRTLGPSAMWMQPVTIMVYPDSTDEFYTELTDDPAAAAS